MDPDPARLRCTDIPGPRQAGKSWHLLCRGDTAHLPTRRATALDAAIWCPISGRPAFTSARVLPPGPSRSSITVSATYAKHAFPRRSGWLGTAATGTDPAPPTIHLPTTTAFKVMATATTTTTKATIISSPIFPSSTNALPTPHRRTPNRHGGLHAPSSASRRHPTARCNKRAAITSHCRESDRRSRHQSIQSDDYGQHNTTGVWGRGRWRGISEEEAADGD